MSADQQKTLRCAIYTRKSSEEGLEQDFNSLHAQREACEAYIKSQRHEGWSLVPTIYDDGGYSGGTLERPAVQRLLADIKSKNIDIVVVYKVDRLTRSLTDFARIVETFDQCGASFVSVTQAFNTTTSMGRLTLNVLLSFAQFQREVTGERIRDKIAASKKKGLWMGGNIPLGYAPNNRTLVVVPEDAETVRGIFRRYLELQSVPNLVRELNAAGQLTKRRTSKTGKERGGRRYFQGAVYHLLKNPIYLGEIRHKGTRYPGQQEAIIDRQTWDKVQSALLVGARRTTIGLKTDAILRGKLFDTAGNRMTPTHSRKPDGRRYRFYVSLAYIKGKPKDNIELPRISAGSIEQLVTDALSRQPGAPTMSDVQRITVGQSRVRIELCQNGAQSSPIDLPICLGRRGNNVEIRHVGSSGDSSAASPDRALLKALIRAYRWRKELESGACKSIAQIANREKANECYIGKLLQLTFLAPNIIDAILDGRQTERLSLSSIRKTSLPIDWSQQRRLFA